MGFSKDKEFKIIKGGQNMNYSDGALSPSDVALITGNTGNSRNNDGWGDNGAW